MKQRLGMVIAIESEIRAFLSAFGSPKAIYPHGIIRVYYFEKENVEIFAAYQGVEGEIAAAAATQLLISLYSVSLIGNFGVVGALTPAAQDCSLCIVEKIVHYDYDVSAVDPVSKAQYAAFPSVYIPATPELIEKITGADPSIPKVVCCSGDKFILGEANKKNLAEEFRADICDMESAAIALTCIRNQIPFFLLKSIADAYFDGGSEYYEKKIEAGRMCMEAALRFIEKPF